MVTAYTVLKEGQVISKRVDEAHGNFNTTSIYEVIDLDKQAVTEVLNIIYDNPGSERIERYLRVLERLR